MRDKDTVSDDDMATLTIPICSLPPGQVIDQWYNMIPCRRVKKGGRIHLILHVAPFGATAFVPQPTFQQNFMGMQNTMMGMGRLMNPMMGAVPPNPMYHPQPMNLQPAMYPQMMNQQQMLRQSQPTMYPQMMNQQQMLRQSQPTMMNQPMVQPIPMYQPPQNPYNQNMMPMQNGFGQTPRPYNINASIPGMSEKDIRKMQKRQRQMMGY
ncbi:C2 domain containing protein [Histomonas meleagridis]|uniref:C2 domain containing protein n=1 Tax=Histomonas meleagridis TaxID=135588 RepID=UPI00355A06C6|nr:C2 domain containing protein [Histomonas meleagridis]KAH0803103.1 C2 domain containing protein [Histomonas meleagridis]